MLLTLDALLTAEELATARGMLARSPWVSGQVTAGPQAAQVKQNQQLSETAPHLPALRELVLGALHRSPLFFSAALPLRILTPFFNRYSGVSNHYGYHVDNALRASPGGGYVRADVSATLFLSEPETYAGGVLTIQDTFGTQSVKLKAGSLVLYPASSLHQVTPVTQGERLACFMFIQSLVRDAEQRRLLFEMDMALLELRQQLGEAAAPLMRLTGTYHNLLRRWAED